MTYKKNAGKQKEDKTMGPSGPVYRGTSNTNTPKPKAVGMKIKKNVTTSQALVDYPINKNNKAMGIKETREKKVGILTQYDV